MARSQGNSRGGARKAQPPEPDPGDLAREAAAEWKLAVQYAAAAVKPAFGRTAGALKDRAVERWTDRTTLKDRLTTSGADKGGKIGDAADALLAKTGAPGKLAAKAGVGSRVVERMRANGDGEPEQPEADEAEPEEAETAAEAEDAEAPEADEQPDAEAEPDDEPEPDEVEEEPEPEEQPAAEADEEAPQGEGSAGEEEAAASDWLEHDNAYSEEVEQYEHHDAYEMSSS